MVRKNLKAKSSHTENLDKKIEELVQKTIFEMLSADKKNDEIEDLLTVSQAAQFLSISERVLREKIKNGELPARKFSCISKYYLLKSELIECLKNQGTAYSSYDMISREVSTTFQRGRFV